MLGSTDGHIHPRTPAHLVRTEPRDVAPVIALPVRMHSNRVIQPLDVPVGTLLGERDHGPLARALLGLDGALAR